MVQDQVYLEKCISLAKQSVKEGGGPFSAIIVQNGDILAEANNRVTLDHDPTAHAEVCAIRQACRKLSSFELKKTVLYASSEPCPMCLAAIYWARIPEVVYINTCFEARQAGFDDSFIYQQLNLPHQEKKLHITQTPLQSLQNEAKLIFTDWLQKADRVDY